MIVRDDDRLRTPAYRRLEHFARMNRRLIQQPVRHAQRGRAERMVLRVKRQDKETFLFFSHECCLAEDAIGILRLGNLDSAYVLTIDLIPPSHKFERRRELQHLELPDALDLPPGMQFVVFTDVPVERAPIAFDKLRHRPERIEQSPCCLQYVATRRSSAQQNRQERLRLQFGW